MLKDKKNMKKSGHIQKLVVTLCIMYVFIFKLFLHKTH